MNIPETEAFDHLARRRTVAFVLMGLTRTLSITKHLVPTIGCRDKSVEYWRVTKSQGILRHTHFTITPAAERPASPVARG